MSAPAFLAEKAARVDAALEACLATWENVPERLEEAVRYSLFAGGKRLRPALTLTTAELISGDDSPALPAAPAQGGPGAVPTPTPSQGPPPQSPGNPGRAPKPPHPNPDLLF